MKMPAVSPGLTALLLVVFSIFGAEGQVRLAWVARYAGESNVNDIPMDIAADDQGNAYVTGRSELIASPDRSVRLRHYATVKFGAGGRLVWERQYRGGPIGHNHAVRILRDAAGYLYVTGGSGSNAAPQIATLKYDPDGNLIWLSRFGADGENWPADMALDATGNVFVTGVVNGFIGGPDQGLMYLTFKIGPNGQVLWSQKFRPTRQEVPSGIAVSPFGDVCVTGHFPNGAGLGDIASVKYTADGTEAWVRRFGTANEPSAEFGRAVAFDRDGNVYVTGGGTPGFLTFKYQADGTPLWSALYPRPSGASEQYATRIAIDPDGNVIVGGTAYHATERANWGIVKYAPDGTELWARQYNHPNGGNDTLAGMAVDNEGSIYVAGSMETNYLGLSFLVTAKYSRDGEELWRAEYASSSPPHDRAVDLAVDAAGAVYVLAESFTATDGDYLVLKYEQAQPAARFVEITKSASGIVSLTIFAKAGATYDVDISENLRDWAPLTSRFNQTGTIQLTDPVPDASRQRFYRVHSQEE
jgi:hypothetical protein